MVDEQSERGGHGDSVLQSVLKLAVPAVVSAIVGGGVAITSLIKMSHAGFYIAAAGYTDLTADKSAWILSDRGRGLQQAKQVISFDHPLDCARPIIQTAISAFDLRTYDAATATGPSKESRPDGGEAPQSKGAMLVDANTDASETTSTAFPLYIQTNAANVGWINVHWMALCPLKE